MIVKLINEQGRWKTSKPGEESIIISSNSTSTSIIINIIFEALIVQLLPMYAGVHSSPGDTLRPPHERHSGGPPSH